MDVKGERIIALEGGGTCKREKEKKYPQALHCNASRTLSLQTRRLRCCVGEIEKRSSLAQKGREKKSGVLWVEVGDGQGERQGRRARHKAVMSALANGCCHVQTDEVAASQRAAGKEAICHSGDSGVVETK